MSLLCHCACQGGEVACSWLLRQRLLRRSRGVRGSADNEYGTRSLSDYVFCHTAQKHVGESRPPMRPHDNQIHLLLTRCVHNRLRGGPLDEEALCLEPHTLYSLSTRLQEVLRIGLQVVQISRSHSGGHLVHGHRGQVEHMEEGEPCLELLCQGNGIRQCSVCRGAKVYGDKHVLDDHGSLLQCMEAKGQRCGTFLLLYPVRDAKTSLSDAWGLPGSEDRGGKIQNHAGETTVRQPLHPPLWRVESR